jgi:large subunit ribosomal protein L9
LIKELTIPGVYMKLILRENHDKLGKIGDVINVKDGYARNYLIPRKIAYIATEGNLIVLDEEKKQRELKLQKEIKSAQTLALELEKVSLTMPVQVGEDDKLYGSVTSQMISDSLKEKGYSIDKKQIEIEEPIKVLGIYSVNIRLASNINTKVKVWVVRQ